MNYKKASALARSNIKPTCNSVVVENGTLKAMCLNRRGILKESCTNLCKCDEAIENLNGKLVCGRYSDYPGLGGKPELLGSRNYPCQ